MWPLPGASQLKPESDLSVLTLCLTRLSTASVRPGVVRGYFGLEAIPLDSVLLAIEVTDSSKNANMDVDPNLFAGAAFPSCGWSIFTSSRSSAFWTLPRKDTGTTEFCAGTTGWRRLLFLTWSFR